MTIPVINLDYSGMPADIYCPVCGTPIYAEGRSPSCGHVVFTYITEIGDFDHVSPHMEAQVATIRERAEDDEHLDPVSTLLGQMDSTSILCFSVTTTGVACGPTSSTVYVAVDFCPTLTSG